MDKVTKTLTVTFRYNANSKVPLTNGPATPPKLAKSLKEVHTFLTKETILNSDHALLQRLIYKFNSQLRHFKSFKNFKRINQYLTKFSTFLISFQEEAAHLSECCVQEQNAIFLPSKQMLEYFLAKSMQISFVLRKVVIFSMNTYEACLSSIHRAELTGAHLLFCSLSSRIWIIARSVILNLVDWYGQLYPWLPHLKGTEAECLYGFKLAEDLKPWLDGKCPVEDDPTKVEGRPTEADGVLAKFTAGEEMEFQIEGAGVGEGVESSESQGDSTGSDNEVSMAVARKTRQTTKSNMQEICRPSTSREDLGIVVKRKMFDSPRNSPRSSPRNSPRNSPKPSDDESSSKRRKHLNTESKLARKKKVKNGSNGTTNGTSNNQASSEPAPKPTSSNGVFAVPKKRQKAKKRLSKIDYKKAMKVKLKKPSRFLEELSHSSIEINQELILLPHTSRRKLVQELKVLLQEFNVKRNQINKEPEQKSQILKQVKKLRLAFKRHARDSLWTLIQDK